MPERTTTVASTWHSDFSGLPFSRRRAYGSIQKTPFVYQDATVKKLKPISFVGQNGEVTSQLDVYALTLSSSRNSAIIYFTAEAGQPFNRIDYRRKPNDPVKKSSAGITTLQFMAPDPKTEIQTSNFYREGFSARLALAMKSDGKLTGSIIAVYPDSQRSFVTGAFKARLVE